MFFNIFLYQQILFYIIIYNGQESTPLLGFTKIQLSKFLTLTLRLFHF